MPRLTPKIVAGVTCAIGASVLILTDSNTGQNHYTVHHDSKLERSKRDLTLTDAITETLIKHPLNKARRPKEPPEIHEVQIVDDLSDMDDLSFQKHHLAPDQWAQENNTENWVRFYTELGIDLEFDDDVTFKARRNKWAKLREDQLEQLHDKMQQEYIRRNDKLMFFNEISGVTYGQHDPRITWDINTGYDDGNYTGFTDTAPIVKTFLKTFDCRNDGKTLWRGKGSTNIWIMVPGAVPLFTRSDKHVIDYGYYWKFMMRMVDGWPTERTSNLRFSIGAYSTKSVFTPRGYKYKANTPWSRIHRYYKKPRMTAIQPKLFTTVKSLLTFMPRYGLSSASAGDNCVLIWFWQDVPSDVNDFLIPEAYETLTQLHSVCTVIPVVIGPEAKTDAWKKFMANFQPGLKTGYAKDPDYTGTFHLDKLADLVDNNFISHINNYMCLVEHRATCRLKVDAWVPPPSDTGATEAGPTEGFRAVDYEEYGRVDYEPTATAGESATKAPKIKGPTVKPPEIDSCCGHNGWTATPYDSELKTCCEDSQIKPWTAEGGDPCMDEEFYDN